MSACTCGNCEFYRNVHLEPDELEFPDPVATYRAALADALEKRASYMEELMLDMPGVDDHTGSELRRAAAEIRAGRLP